MNQASAQEIKDSILHYAEDRLQTLVDLCEAKDKRIEELEQTAVVRGMIGMYDHGLVDGGMVYTLLEMYAMEFDVLPQWMKDVGKIFTDWHDDPLSMDENAVGYINRIREVIGMPKREE